MSLENDAFLLIFKNIFNINKMAKKNIYLDVIRLERLSKKPKDKMFLIGYSDIQFFITTSLLLKNLPFIYFWK